MKYLTLILLLLTSPLFAQEEMKLKQVSALIADSVTVEELADKVAVFLPEKVERKLGIEITLNTDAKNAAILILDSKVKPYQANKASKPNIWYSFVDAGKYTVVYNSPEKGFIVGTIDVGQVPEDPDDPPDTDPPAGDFSALVKAAKTVADELKDEQTRLALASAYSSAANLIAGKDYKDSTTIVAAARFAVLNARKGPSRAVDWNRWLKAVDAELVKVVPAGDAVKYKQSIEAIVSGLNN